ncbi:hypothetical protein IV203_026557 [Nitzschia inconspicua]|uniref:Uncharacterized protein n=1 Tax=Nitzschia inconspicua TaxID=303405 RepID=A0A9K3LJG3_9STRA|nr:hypothetical protein IV203_026557 [Nitzschia inconspicua]
MNAFIFLTSVLLVICNFVEAFCFRRISTTLPALRLSTSIEEKDQDDPFLQKIQSDPTKASLHPTSTRYQWLETVGIAVATAGALSLQPAWALKPRNEALCGTGLFTNFLEYRCTDLGDISDEGQKTSFSNTNDAGTADSLLSKLNLGVEDNSNVDTLGDSMTKENGKSTWMDTTSTNRED